MKIREEKKVIEQIVKSYIAEDGAEFITQKDCENYESNLVRLQYEKQLEERLTSIKNISFTPILVDNDHEYKWFYVTNQEELNTVQDFYNINSSYGISYTNVSFPEWVGIEEGYDGDIWEAGTLAQYQENVSNMIKQFEQ